ncbi:hypothetical protein XENTR_v10017490 [Xenopus tropicalis]|nr:hypothetical protein XENTR_v10017490 [Xenopus tropicalis]
MQRLLSLLLVLGTAGGQYSGVKVTQTPKFLSIKPGDGAEFHCHQDNENFDFMYWYRQEPGNEPTLMMLSRSAGSVEMESPYQAEWEAERNRTTNSSLQLKGGNGGDSATYLCATSLHSH